MKTLLFGLTSLFTLCLATPSFAVSSLNQGFDWSNYDGTFTNPVSAPGESQSQDILFDSIIAPTTVNVTPTGTATVGDPIRSNGGPAATQAVNGISLNSLFFKPDGPTGSGAAGYKVDMTGTLLFPAGNALYMYSIGQTGGFSSIVTLSAFDATDTLITSFTTMEIDLLGPTFTASNTVTTIPGITAQVRNSDVAGTTNTKLLAFIFPTDVKLFTLDIVAAELSPGNFDGFNVGLAIVPEPSTYLLMGSALAGVLLLARKKRKARS